MNLGLENKVFVISGSSRGIGKGIAVALLEEGARVVLTGRDAMVLVSVFVELSARFAGKVLFKLGDLNRKEILHLAGKLALKEWGKNDGLVANAGAVRPTFQEDIPDWRWYFTANFHIARCFVEHFLSDLRKTMGSIVFISSIAAIEDVGAPLPYSASKAALNVYAKGLARKLAPDRIRVNTVAPGNILFAGGNWDKKQKADAEGIQKMLNEKVPLKRFGSPEDIGNIVAFLLSERAGFITGSCFVVDGGQTRRI